ncbi:Alpha/beta hydrolase OS=Streptomyces tendae OX=1932 GN=GUR47_29715 PE=3 SV=1 [Streptomyces tendae]
MSTSPPGRGCCCARSRCSHGVTGLVNPCVNDRVDAYLLTGTLDSRDVTCAPHATPKP